MGEHRDGIYLAEFINTEPVVFLGCTVPELSMVVSGSILLCVPLLGGTVLLIGGLPLAAAAAAVGSLLCCIGSAQLLRHLKRGKPDAHYRLLVLVAMARLGACKTLLIHTGNWGIGRSVPAGRRR